MGTIDDDIEATVAAKVAELGNGGEGGTPGPGQQEIRWGVRPG